MKKSTTVIFILILSLVSTLVFAQEFKIDGNIGEAGFQDSQTIINGIGGGQRIGFAVYVNDVTAMVGFDLTMTWDSAKASLVTASSGPAITAGAMNINGMDVTAAAEANVLGSPAGIPTPGTGTYNAAYVLLGSGNVDVSDWSLVFFAVFQTAAGFTTSQDLAIETTLKVADTNSSETDLGKWDFYVNSSVGVDDKTWGEIKSDFNF